ECVNSFRRSRAIGLGFETEIGWREGFGHGDMKRSYLWGEADDLGSIGSAPSLCCLDVAYPSNPFAGRTLALLSLLESFPPADTDPQCIEFSLVSRCRRGVFFSHR
ncbi:unnamed protein product, partial [Scytosiphon promiscuus]